MLRATIGVVVGFVVLSVGVIVTFAVTMAVLGDGVYQPGTYWTTDKFNIIVLIGGTLAAVVGGVVCGLIARSRTPVIVLAALLLVFGTIGAVMNHFKPDPPPATGKPTLTEIQQHGKEPTWFAYTKSILGAAGALVGGWGLAKRKNQS